VIGDQALLVISDDLTVLRSNVRLRHQTLPYGAAHLLGATRIPRGDRTQNRKK
jgi:hypothetical protein